jgi:hypothetical protein
MRFHRGYDDEHRPPCFERLVKQAADYFVRDMEEQAQTLHAMGFATEELVCVVPERGFPHVTIKPRTR